MVWIVVPYPAIPHPLPWGVAFSAYRTLDELTDEELKELVGGTGPEEEEEIQR